MKVIFGSVMGIVALFLIFFGCLFMSIGGAVYYFTIYAVSDWVEVPGVVTTFSSNTSTDSDGFTTTYYCPWVEFTTASGATREVLVNDCSSPRAYEAGEAVTVIYNPADPEQVELKGGVREIVGNIIGIGFAVVGCIPVVLGLIFLIVGIVGATRRSRPSTAAVM